MTNFQALADATVDELLELSPEEATALGEHRFDDRLADRSQAGVEAATRRLRERQRELAGIDRTELEAEPKIDLEVLKNELELRILVAEEVHPTTWNPLVYNPGDGIFSLLSQATQPPELRLRSVCGRLEAIPGLVELAQRQLANPPRVHVETALQQHPGVVRLIQDEVDRLAANISDIGLRGRVAKAQSLAITAWATFGAYLEDALESAQGEFRLGPELFARKLRLDLHSPLSPEQVLARAEQRLEVLTEELAEACAELAGGDGSPREVIQRALDQVAETRPDDHTVLTEASGSLAELTSTVRASGLFTIPEDPYDLEVVPEFMRGTASAYCMPAGPFEEGAHSKVMIAPTPDDWPADRVESFYREINSAMLVMLMAHEAMPGHVLQLAVSRSFQGPTRARAAFFNGPFVEGWACHAERIVRELGLGGLPVRTQQIKVHLRCTLNAVLDAAVHAEGMGEEEAVTMLIKRGFQERAEAEGKWRRACLTSTQLSTYFVGYTELQDLFQKVGPISSYDPVLEHGSPPVSLLAGLLADDGAQATA